MKSKDVYLFVFDGMSDWEASYAIAGINNPQFQKNPGKYQVRTVAFTNTHVVTIGGIRIQPDLTLKELSTSNSSMLILPGGTAWEEEKNNEAIKAVKTFFDSGISVAAICGATFSLAKTGLLNSRRHTSNASEYLALTQYSGAALYEDKPAVTDRNLITASRIAPVDFAYHIFKYLDIYTDPVLEAWYKLFKTGNAKYFTNLMNVANM